MPWAHCGPLGRGRGDDLGLQSECWIPAEAGLHPWRSWPPGPPSSARLQTGPWAPRPSPPPHLTAECWALPGLTVVLGFPQVVDKWFKSNDEEAFAFARMLIAQEGLLCGEWMPQSALPASVQRVRDTLALAARPPARGSEFRGRLWWCSAEQMGDGAGCGRIVKSGVPQHPTPSSSTKDLSRAGVGVPTLGCTCSPPPPWCV